MVPQPSSDAALSSAPTVSSFPLVKVAEIVDTLNGDSLRIPVTLEDLRKPTSDVVCRIFKVFLEHLSGLTEEDFEKKKDMRLAYREYREAYEESTTLAILYGEVKALMECSRVPDFRMQDLTRPDPKRLRKQLSALINFHLFKDDCLTVYNDYQDEAQTVIGEREDLIDRVAELEDELATKLAALQRDEPQVEQLRQENSQKAEELKSLRTEQATLMTTLEEKSKAKALAVAELTQVIEDHRLLKMAVDTERGCLVMDPGRLRTALQTGAERLHKQKEQVAEVVQRKQQVQKKLAVLTGLKSDVEANHSLLQTVHDIQSRIVADERRLGTLETEIDQLQQDIGQVNHRDGQSQSKLATTQTKLNRLRADVELKRGLQAKKKTAFEETWATTMAEKTARLKEVEETNARIVSVEKDFDDLERSHLAFRQNMLKERDNLVNKTNLYIETLSRKFDMAT